MLHTLSRSPYQIDFDALLRTMSDGDALLLLEDAVSAVVDGGAFLPRLVAANIEVYVLNEDVIARGLSTLLAVSVKTVDYGGFVDLTITHPTQMAW